MTGFNPGMAINSEAPGGSLVWGARSDDTNARMTSKATATNEMLQTHTEISPYTLQNFLGLAIVSSAF